MTREWFNIHPLLHQPSKEESTNSGYEIVSSWISSEDIRGLEFWIDKQTRKYMISIYLKKESDPHNLFFDDPKLAWKKWGLIQGALGVKGVMKRGPKKVVFEKFNPEEYNEFNTEHNINSGATSESV